MGLIGSICGTLYSQLDTSKMSSCEAQASRVHCTTVVATCAVCRRVYLATGDSTYMGCVQLFAKSAKCASSGLPQALSVQAPPQKGPLLRPPTHPPTNTHTCNCSTFLECTL